MSRLSRNDMLSTGGNRRRKSRGSCYVNKPAYGFFIAGSSFKAMNGVYIRENPPAKPASSTKRDCALYYTHDDSGWAMSLEKLSKNEDDEQEESSDDDYNYYGYRYRPPKPKKPEYEWVFIDPEGRARFSHEGDTIIPGAGVRWSFLHRSIEKSSSADPSPEDSTAAAAKVPASSRDAKNSKQTSTIETEEEVATKSNSDRGNQIVEAEKDDEDQLPWQVIALLDHEILQQLVWAARSRKKRVAQSMSGGSATKPSRYSLEGCYVPGRFLFRVVAQEGLKLYSEPTVTSSELSDPSQGGDGPIAFLSYVIGVEVTKGGQWVKLDSKKHPPPNSFGRRYGNFGSYYDASYSHTQNVWCQVYSSAGSPILVQVDACDMPYVDSVKEGEGQDGGLGDDGEIFDKPFVPRVENNTEDLGDPEPNIDAMGIDDSDDDEDDDFSVASDGVSSSQPVKVSVVEQIKQDAAAAMASSSLPVGAAVIVGGLSGTSEKYNGVNGVVISPIDSAVGRHGVRLDAPFSGKKLLCHPLNLTPVDALSLSGSHQDNNSDSDSERNDESSSLDAEILKRHARTLDIPLEILTLEPKSAGSDKTTAPLLGFALAGREPMERLRAAIRAAERDTRGNISASTAAEEAGSYLSSAILNPPESLSKGTVDENEYGVSSMPPDLMVRSGILGSRAAAAAVAANSRNNLKEAERGVEALRRILADEMMRRADLISMTADDGGIDETRLRLALISALLHGGRDHTALTEANIAVAKAPFSAAAALLHSRCLFRCANRTNALDALKRAATGDASNNLGTPDARWAHSEAVRMLRAVKQAETKRVRAIDA